MEKINFIGKNKIIFFIQSLKFVSKKKGNSFSFIENF